MPHMMPMLWLMMLIFSLFSLFMILSMLYFMYLPPFKKIPLPPSSSFKKNWNWKW